LGRRFGAPCGTPCSNALREGSKLQTSLRKCLVEQSGALFTLPAHIGDYTDFYTSIHHATASAE